MTTMTLDELENNFNKSDSKYVFRGQNRDYGNLFSNIYRNLIPYKHYFHNVNELAEQVDQSQKTTVPSKDVANALVAWKVNMDRYFRFGFPLTRFLEVFYPDSLKVMQDKNWQGTLGHIMALHQHLEIKTPQLDVSWDPIVSAWFACHKWTNKKFEPVDDTTQPVIYLFDVSKINNRIRDLKALPEFMLRPNRQCGATIFTSFIEDLYSLATEKIFLDPTGTVDFFAERNISEAYLFPNHEDPLFELLEYWLQHGYDFPYLMNWIEANTESALYKVFKDRRKQVIISLCLKYDAFWVRDINDCQIIINHPTFDSLNQACGDLREFQRDMEDFAYHIFDGSSELLEQILEVEGDPYSVEWTMLDSPVYFSPENWGSPEDDPFAQESIEITYKQSRAIRKRGDSYQIDWNLT